MKQPATSSPVLTALRDSSCESYIFNGCTFHVHYTDKDQAVPISAIEQQLLQNMRISNLGAVANDHNLCDNSTETHKTDLLQENPHT